MVEMQKLESLPIDKNEKYRETTSSLKGLGLSLQFYTPKHHVTINGRIYSSKAGIFGNANDR